MKKDWSLAVAQALADALTAFMTLQAKQGMHEAYSEYLLYDPIVRVAMHRGWAVRSEVKLQKLTPKKGDNQRIDFVFSQKTPRPSNVLLEVKYQKRLAKTVDVRHDLEKLKMQLDREPRGTRALLVVAGRLRRRQHRHATNVDLGAPLYKTSYAGAHTNFGVTVFRVG